MQDKLLIKQSRVPASICPCCKKKLDGVSGPREPQAGDVTVCIVCGTIMEFDENLLMQEASKGKLDFLRDHKTEIYVQLMMISKSIQQERVQRN